MSKSNVIAVAGVLIGLLGFVGPILWDIYKEKTEITVELHSYRVIFDNDNSLKDLSIKYKDREIKKLYRAQYKIKNTGNKSITEKHYGVAPISIGLQSYEKIIEVRVSKNSPENLNAKIKYNNKNGEITTNKTILNPEDYYVISVLTEGKNINFGVKGSILGTLKKHTNRLVELGEDEEKNNNKKIAVYFLLFSLVMSIVIGQLYIREEYTKYLLRNMKFNIPNNMSRWATRSYLSRRFSFIDSESGKLSLLRVLDELENSPDFSGVHQEKITLEVEKLMSREDSNRVPALSFLGLLVLAIIIYFSNF